MLKTTRNKEEKQTEPSKTLVPIIRNRVHIKTARLIQRTALFTEIRPRQIWCILLCRLAQAAVSEWVSDAQSLPFSQTHL